MLQIISKTKMMTPEQFVYWMKGYVEISNNSDGIGSQEWQIIKDHLNQVFDKRTPDYSQNPNYLQPSGTIQTNPGTTFIC